MNNLIYICWGAWGLAWAAGWLVNAVQGPRTERRSLGWSFWAVVLIAFALLRLVPARPVAGAVPQGAWPLAAGAVLLVAGTAFTLWARWVLGHMWSSDPSVKAGHELRTDGPYAITRHPIYTGMIAMMAGSALMEGGVWIALVAAFAVYIALKIREEERLMVATFGERYARYRRETPQVIPGLRRH